MLPHAVRAWEDAPVRFGPDVVPVVASDSTTNCLWTQNGWGRISLPNSHTAPYVDPTFYLRTSPTNRPHTDLHREDSLFFKERCLDPLFLQYY
jgi:hypothetical protein